MASAQKPIFELFYLDGFSWADALDFFRVPHYSNDHSGRGEEQGPFSFKFTTVTFEGDPGCVTGVVVLWANRPEPTQEEIQAEDDKDDQTSFEQT